MFSYLAIIAPLLVFLTVGFLGKLTPGYSHTVQVISDLGRHGASFPMWMNLFGFILPGLMVAGFAYRISKYFKPSQLAPILLIVSGLSWAGLGIFPNYLNEVSPIHALMGYLSAGSGGIAIIMFSYAFNKSSWKKLSKLSFITGWFLLARVLTVPFNLGNYRGLIQRIFIGVFFLWVAITAIKVLEEV